jgi:hypothetical protein
MFWDGTRWVDESTRSPVHPTPQRRLRNFAATGVMALALVGLIVPLVGTSAAGPPAGSSLLEDWSAGGSVKTYNENSGSVAYRGKWSRADHPNYIDGHVRFTDGRKAKASLKFSGSAVSWIGPVGPTRGKARIYIDGKFVKTVDTYASSFKPARVLYKATWDTVRTRRITIVTLATKGRSTVALDAFIVRTSGKPAPPDVSKPKQKATNVAKGDPKVLLSEDIGPAGTKTVLSLSGFAGGTSGAIKWDGSTHGMPAYRTAADGTDSVSLTVPQSATVGKHEIDTYGPDGEHLTMRIFEVTVGDPAQTSTATPTLSPAPTSAPSPTATPTGTPDPTAAPTKTPAPTAAPTKTPAPTAAPTKTPAPSTTYAAVFSGDATGATDVSSSLASFIASHSGQRIALAVDGVYKVTRVVVEGVHDQTLDFRGSRLVTSVAQDLSTFELRGSARHTINDAYIVGSGYSWTFALEGQHAVHLVGGQDITFNRLITRDTRGDGIYLAHYTTFGTPKNVVLNQPDIQRAARNGVAVVAGELTVNGGKVDRAGLHAVDLEPNDATGASSTKVTLNGLDMRRADDIIAVPGLGYAVGAGWGYTSARKPLLRVMNCTGDTLEMAVSALDTIVVTGNVSGSQATFEHWNSGTTTFSGNTRLTLYDSN